jgi:hypothetical protein
MRPGRFSFLLGEVAVHSLNIIIISESVFKMVEPKALKKGIGGLNLASSLRSLSTSSAD